jgi:hypothetical protein
MSPTSSKKTPCALNALIQSLPSVWSLPGTLEESKNHNSAEPWKGPEFPQNLHLISLLSIMAKLFEKLILRTIQKYTEERKLLTVSQFCFQEDHSVTLQCMSLADHVTQNFDNMLMAAVFLDTEKAINNMTLWPTV